MEWLLIVLLFPLPMWMSLANDPAPGINQDKAESRNLDCARLSTAEAHALYPGHVEPPEPRGSFIQTDALVCKTRIMQSGERVARDEAILSNLSQRAADIAEAAQSRANAAALRWLVEAYYPEPAVAAKIAFAVKNALVERRLAVSDRAPALAAADIHVLARMPALQAYPTACARYFAEGSLGDDQVLLGVALLDARATELYAGICARGEWSWLP